LRTSTTLAPGNRAQHLLDPRIGFGGALTLVFLNFVLRTQRRLSGLVGYNHGPAAVRFHCSSLREKIVDQRPARRLRLQRKLEPPIFDADQADVRFERGFCQQVALFASKRPPVSGKLEIFRAAGADCGSETGTIICGTRGTPSALARGAEERAVDGCTDDYRRSRARCATPRCPRSPQMHRHFARAS